MLILPADGSPGIFVDKLCVESVTPDLSDLGRDPDGYVVALSCGVSVAVSCEHGERLLAEIAGKEAAFDGQSERSNTPRIPASTP